jgi:hypothetical protein
MELRVRGVWSVTKKPIVLFEGHFHATEKSEAIACARRCRSSRLTRWWTKKNNRKKWRAEEEERHKGSLTPPPKKKMELRKIETWSVWVLTTGSRASSNFPTIGAIGSRANPDRIRKSALTDRMSSDEPQLSVSGKNKIVSWSQS